MCIIGKPSWQSYIIPFSFWSKKEVRKAGRQGGCETGEEKGFPSYCPITQAGTTVGAAVSL